MSGLDFSGVDQFLSIADTLMAGEQPSAASWDALFGTPGYRSLTASEFRPELFQRAWRRGLSPQPDAAPDQAPATEKRMAEHARTFISRRDEVVRFRDELERRQEWLMAAARDLAREYLPPGEYGRWSRVSFVVFDRDARGYVPVVVDLLYALALGPDSRLAALLAHEFHHQQVLALRGLGGGGPDTRSDLNWILDQIHLEGIADMITVPLMPEGEDLRRFMAHVEGAPTYLRQLDRGIREADRHPSLGGKTGHRLRSDLVLSGHPAGYYMASTIAAGLGKEQLTWAAADPVLFFRAFRQASMMAGGEPPLSEDAVAAVERMFYHG